MAANEPQITEAYILIIVEVKAMGRAGSTSYCLCFHMFEVFHNKHFLFNLHGLKQQKFVSCSYYTPIMDQSALYSHFVLAERHRLVSFCYPGYCWLHGRGKEPWEEKNHGGVISWCLRLLPGKWNISRYRHFIDKASHTATLNFSGLGKYGPPIHSVEGDLEILGEQH